MSHLKQVSVIFILIYIFTILFLKCYLKYVFLLEYILHADWILNWSSVEQYPAAHVNLLKNKKKENSESEQTCDLNL